MTEYIERKIALSIREPSKSDRHYQTYNLDDAYGQGWDDALCCIESIPIADVAPVRHGHWIYHPDDLFPNDSTQECSYCHTEESLTLYNENYCPNCGAKMDEVSGYPCFTQKTNADRIRSMSNEELAEFLTDINPINCQNCVFSHGWRCQPDRDDYSDFEKCKEGRKRWLQQPAEVSK